MKTAQTEMKTSKAPTEGVGENPSGLSGRVQRS